MICETKALLQTGYPSVAYKKLAHTSEFTKDISDQYWRDPTYEKSASNPMQDNDEES